MCSLFHSRQINSTVRLLSLQSLHKAHHSIILYRTHLHRKRKLQDEIRIHPTIPSNPHCAYTEQLSLLPHREGSQVESYSSTENILPSAHSQFTLDIAPPYRAYLPPPLLSLRPFPSLARVNNYRRLVHFSSVANKSHSLDQFFFGSINRLKTSSCRTGSFISTP